MIPDLIVVDDDEKEKKRRGEAIRDYLYFCGSLST